MSELAPEETPEQTLAPAGSRRTVLANVSLVSAARYLAEAIFAVRGLVIARVLGPEVFGVWSSMRLVRGLSVYAPLGCVSGMMQLAPGADARGDAALARSFRANAAAVAFGSTALVALGVVLFAGLSSPGSFVAGGTPWLVFGALLLVGVVQRVNQACLRSMQRFDLSSGANLAIAALTTGLGIAGAWYQGLTGFLVALVFCYALVPAIVIPLGRALPRPAFQRDVAGRLFRTGWPILLSNLSATLGAVGPRLLLWALAGTTLLGIYSVPIYVTGLVGMLPAAVSTVLYPRLLQSMAREGPAAAWPVLEGATVLLAAVVCPLLGCLFLTLHVPFEWLLPRYEDSIEPGRVLVLASFFWIAAGLPGIVLISLGAPLRLAAIRLAGAVISGLAVFIVLADERSLFFVALAASLGDAIVSLVTLRAAVARSGLARGARFIGRVFAPYALLLALLVVVDPGPHPSDGILGALWRCALVGVPTGAWAAASAWRWQRRAE